jgi:hypothetical protein
MHVSLLRCHNVHKPINGTRKKFNFHQIHQTKLDGSIFRQLAQLAKDMCLEMCQIFVSTPVSADIAQVGTLYNKRIDDCATCYVINVPDHDGGHTKVDKRMVLEHTHGLFIT